MTILEKFINKGAPREVKTTATKERKKVTQDVTCAATSGFVDPAVFTDLCEAVLDEMTQTVYPTFISEFPAFVTSLVLPIPAAPPQETTNPTSIPDIPPPPGPPPPLAVIPPPPPPGPLPGPLPATPAMLQAQEPVTVFTPAQPHGRTSSQPFISRNRQSSTCNVAFGIKRGACTIKDPAPGCDCALYRFLMTGPDSGGACLNCGHFPTQHVNLGTASSQQLPLPEAPLLDIPPPQGPPPPPTPSSHGTPLAAHRTLSQDGGRPASAHSTPDHSPSPTVRRRGRESCGPDALPSSAGATAAAASTAAARSMLQVELKIQPTSSSSGAAESRKRPSATEEESTSSESSEASGLTAASTASVGAPPASQQMSTAAAVQGAAAAAAAGYNEAGSQGQWFLDSKEVDMEKTPIGSGRSATVYKGRWRNQDVAVKILKEEAEAKTIEDFRLEFQFLSSLRSPHFVYFYGVVVNPPHVWFLLEWCARGSLNGFMNKTDVQFTWDLFFKFAAEAARGLSCLHNWKPQIVHRDFKSHNLLITENWQLKITDFGLSRFLGSNAETLAKVRGTYAYCCPEVYFGNTCTDKSDVFSLGIVLWEMATRCIKGEYIRPYAENSDMQFDFQILLKVSKTGLRPTIPSTCPAEVSGLLKATWDAKPDNRPTAAGALKNITDVEAIYKTKMQKKWDRIREKPKKK